jgi:CheY-like chemotaxis protein
LANYNTIEMTPSIRQGRRILVVDDEDDIREVAAVSLEGVGGHEVLTARGGREALAVATADRPDAILLDVMMPDLDGPSTFALLQGAAETRDIPVIFLTAKAQDADIRAFEELGVTAVLVKPFDPMTLAREIERILGWS